MSNYLLSHHFESLCEGKLSTHEAHRVLLALGQQAKTTGKMPDLDQLKTVAAIQRGCYIVDILTAFFCQESAEKKRLRTQLMQKKQKHTSQFRKIYFYPNDKDNPNDEIAQNWQLASGMRPAKIKGFLDLQRRSY
jgi:hypothetical protein